MNDTNPFISAYYLAGVLLLDEGLLEVKAGNRVGTTNNPRVRRSVESVRNEIGASLFRRAYRMSYESFLRLHDLLHLHIEKAFQRLMLQMILRRRNRQSTKKRKRGKRRRINRSQVIIPASKIDSTVRLAVALRYFAGGDVYDIAPLYGVSRSSCFASVWILVDAVHNCDRLGMSFPTSHVEQRVLADEFHRKSDAGFRCCVAAVDGMLIWIQRPSEKEARGAKCGPQKFFCGRKHKYGLNCQVVCDARGRFLDMSILYPGSSADVLAFEASTLFSKLEGGLLAPDLCLFGDNAYVNSPFLATPYTNTSSGPKDSYNFFHSQLRIRVDYLPYSFE